MFSLCLKVGIFYKKTELFLLYHIKFTSVRKLWKFTNYATLIEYIAKASD